MSWDEGWKRAARDYHAARNGRAAVAEIDADKLSQLRRLLADDVSLERAWTELNTIKGRAAKSTVEALAFHLRGGADVLREPSALRRISQLSEQQLRDIVERLKKEHWGPPWKQDEIETFIRIWIANHGND